ncbi:MAG: diguanylate cyclase [Candidatus Omnitrophota bacterium]
MDREKIIVVKAGPYVSKTINECLKDYDIYNLESFDKAQELYKSGNFHTIVTELDPKENNAVEVVSKLQSADSDIPIIVVTTYDSVPVAVEAMKAGAYDYITKPFNLDELRLVVAHALERQQLKEEVKEKRHFQEMAIMDGLTGIYNRAYFDELIRREEDRARRYPQKFSLLMIDLDDFKQYNDSYGHPAGDCILKNIAHLLSRTIRTSDFAARYGGEEFVIITPHTDKVHASVLASRLLSMVSREVIPVDENTRVSVTISVGLATFGDDAAGRDALVQSADKALYQAKLLGKNRVCLFGT